MLAAPAREPVTDSESALGLAGVEIPRELHQSRGRGRGSGLGHREGVHPASKSGTDGAAKSALDRLSGGPGRLPPLNCSLS